MRLSIIYNDIIPFKGFTALLLGKWLFVRNEERIGNVTLNHEGIHFEQQKEMLFVFFYLWYVVEWLIRLALTFNNKKAYNGVSFEREAYAHEYDKNYLNERKRYTWMKFVLSR